MTRPLSLALIASALSFTPARACPIEQPPLAAAQSTLMWTSTDISSPGGTWQSYTDTAAGWVEGGYSDWRLPTVAELQAAVQDDSFGAMSANVSWLLWTSESQSHNYAWAVVVTTDATGHAMPSQSGQARRVLKTSNLRAKFVRP